MRPFTLRMLSLAMLLLLVITLPTSACPPSGDLWFVSKNSDRVLVVNVESIRKSLSSSILNFAASAVVEVGRIADAIEPGLADVLSDHLPDINPPDEAFVATVWVEGRITPEGWVPIGRRAEIRADFWSSILVPGHRAVVFQEKRFGGTVWSTLPLAGSTLPIRDEDELAQLVEVVSAAQRLPAGTPPPSWTLLALSYPTTRLFTEIRETQFESLVPALLESSSGTRKDLLVLRELRDIEDPRLDALAVSWIEAARDADEEALADCAAEVMLIRLGLVEDDGRDYWVCRGRGMLERWDRLDVEICSMDAASLRDAIESRRAFHEAMTQSLSEAGL